MSGASESTQSAGTARSSVRERACAMNRSRAGAVVMGAKHSAGAAWVSNLGRLQARLEKFTRLERSLRILWQVREGLGDHLLDLARVAPSREVFGALHAQHHAQHG